MYDLSEINESIIYTLNQTLFLMRLHLWPLGIAGALSFIYN